MNPQRIVVLGGPKVGKTTFATKLARDLGYTVKHTDSLIDTLAWSDASAEVSRWLDAPGPWVIEGVTAVRALRKWLHAHPDGTPADAIYLSDTPRIELTKKQVAMTKAFSTIWSEIAVDLLRRGLLVRTF